MTVIPVMAASGEFQTQAQDIAQKWQLPLARTDLNSGLVLWLDDKGLALKTRMMQKWVRYRWILLPAP